MHLFSDIPEYDIAQWQIYTRCSEKTGEMIEQGKRIVFNFPELGTELFHWFYRNEVTDAEIDLPETEWRWEVLDLLPECDNFTSLMELTSNDVFASAQAADIILKAVQTVLPTPEKELCDPGLLRSSVASMEADGPAWKILADQLREKGKSFVVDIKEWTEGIDKDALQVALNAAIDVALKLLERTESDLDLMPWEGMGDGDNPGSIEDKKALIEQVSRSSKLREIIELVGRLKPLAQAKQASKCPRLRHEIDGVELGGNLRDAMPSELAKLANPALGAVFAQKYCSKSLLQYKRGGIDRRQRGPLIVLLDSTGSMRGFREIWSKAVTWIIAAIAVEQKRHCRVIHWGKSALRVDDFSPACKIEKRFIDSMLFFASDGTNQEDAAFDAAVECIRSKQQYKGADIVLITDGGWGDGGDTASLKAWEKRFPDQQKKLGFNVYTILIDSGVGRMPVLLQTNLIAVKDIGKSIDPAIVDRIFGI